MNLHNDRKQLRRIARAYHQIAGLVLAPPLEHLVRVHTVCTRDLRYTRSRDQRLFHDPPLLFNRVPPPSTLGSSRNKFGIRYDAPLHTGIVYGHEHYV